MCRILMESILSGASPPGNRQCGLQRAARGAEGGAAKIKRQNSGRGFGPALECFEPGRTRQALMENFRPHGHTDNRRRDVETRGFLRQKKAWLAQTNRSVGL